MLEGVWYEGVLSEVRGSTPPRGGSVYTTGSVISVYQVQVQWQLRSRTVHTANNDGSR